jgi:hypothetical protein
VKICTAIDVSFETFTALIVQIVAYSGFYSLLAGYQSFGGTCCPNLQGINKDGEVAVIIHRQITKKVVTPVQVRGEGT